jgi:hypothetical protein
VHTAEGCAQQLNLELTPFLSNENLASSFTCLICHYIILRESEREERRRVGERVDKVRGKERVREGEKEKEEKEDAERE